MEFRCETCGHVGAPSSVVPTENGVAMVCAECGAENEISTTEKPKDPDKAGHPSAPQETPKPNSAKPAEKTKAKSNELAELAFERLVPEKGDRFSLPEVHSHHRSTT